MLVAKFFIPAGPTTPLEGRRAYSPSRGLVGFEPQPLASGDVEGRAIEELSTSVGAYGMGGPGFVGFRLGRDWLVVAIWGAAAWIHVGGRYLEDEFFDLHDRPRPWISSAGDELSPLLVGATIAALDIKPKALRLALANGLVATIEDAAALRPPFQGDGAPRAFGPEEDLRRAVFLSPTNELWI